MGYILNGEYHKDDLVQMSQAAISFQSTFKQHDMDRQREDHRADLIQPFLRDGSPNPEFISVYPEESKAYGFIPKENE